MLKNSKMSKKYRLKRKLDERVRQIRKQKQFKFEIDFAQQSKFGSMLEELSLDQIENQLQSITIQNGLLNEKTQQNSKKQYDNQEDIIRGTSFKNIRIKIQDIFEEVVPLVKKTHNIQKSQQQQIYSKQNICKRSRLRRTCLEKRT